MYHCQSYKKLVIVKDKNMLSNLYPFPCWPCYLPNFKVLRTKRNGVVLRWNPYFAFDHEEFLPKVQTWNPNWLKADWGARWCSFIFRLRCYHMGGEGQWVKCFESSFGSFFYLPFLLNVVYVYVFCVIVMVLLVPPENVKRETKNRKEKERNLRLFCFYVLIMSFMKLSFASLFYTDSGIS